CNLELQQTIAAAQIRKLETVQADLETSRNSFVALYEQSPVGYVTLDRRGRIYDANATATGLLGFARKRLLEVPFTALVRPKDVRKVLAHLDRCEQSLHVRVTTEVRLKIV